MEYYELNNPVFAVQGDNIFDLKVKNLIDFHKEKGACLTIVLREVDNVEGLGIADIDKNGSIQRFVEKPNPKDAPSNFANTGLYVLSPGVRKIFREKGVQQIIKGKTAWTSATTSSRMSFKVDAQFTGTRSKAVGLMLVRPKATLKP